ncbi:hypothetical protein [Pleomorphomonas sp. JP5]|uniref:hypothetical protein n=1 Tax=Pleomorphomonas sp. JP5 TaxID=2942998 RepID=UPI002042CCE9|nr:hypothetical protein [Pleomorphomonas sp. JP5]MCM5560345.1 hypothetical protein [Pleomorphomonas sp. JP5]
MYRTLTLAASLLMASEVHSAPEAYVVDFPPPAATPIVAATCDGLDLPCRPDWVTFVTKDFRPFKLAQSIFRFPKAPAHRGNMFAFVEVPYIEHGEEDYDRLQQMVGQTGHSAERLWVHRGLGFSGADFETQYRVAHAVLPSKKATDAIGLCVFPALGEKTAAPDQCVVLAFRSGTKKFLFSSIGFEVGDEGPRLASHYEQKFAPGMYFDKDDSRLEILKSRHDLETLFSDKISKYINNSHLYENGVAGKILNNFDNSDTNQSEISYVVLKRRDPPEEPGPLYIQTIQLRFQFESGGEWWAEMADGTERGGVSYQGNKRDWAVSMNWETRTAVSHPHQSLNGLPVFAFRGPDAIGFDATSEIRNAFLGVMRDICSPLVMDSASSPESLTKGSMRAYCVSD